MNTIHRINQNQAASKYVPLPTSECRFSYLLLRIQLLLFVTTAFFSAKKLFEVYQNAWSLQISCYFG